MNNDNNISLIGDTVYDIVVNKNAEILSDTAANSGKTPISYRYENANGERFLVFNINTRADSTNMLKHYARGLQIAENIPWLSGKKLPAYVYGNPSLYIQCKKNEKGMSVGIWNFFADTAIEPTVELDKNYSSINFSNCSGELLKDKVLLSDIPPFSFVAFEVK